MHQLDRGRARARRDRAARDLRGHGLRGASDGGRAAHEPPVARDGDRRAARPGRRGGASGCCARTTSSRASATGCARWPTRRARSSRAGASCCWRARSLLWTIEGSVYWPWRARSTSTSAWAARSIWSRSRTSSRRCPRRPARSGRSTPPWRSGLHRLGATGSAAVSYVILIRFVLYVPITLVGLVVLVTRYGGWSRLRSAIRLEASSA